jgi:hypothetical protein
MLTKDTCKTDAICNALSGILLDLTKYSATYQPTAINPRYKKSLQSPHLNQQIYRQ